MSVSTQKLTVAEIREYVSDYTQNNQLLNGEEFSDTFISICMDLAVDEYNTLSPLTNLTLSCFPSKSILMWGSLWKMFEGKATLYARNTLSYSDGGVTIPIEEKAQLYGELASNFRVNFMSQARSLKTNLNMQAGWGEVNSDQGLFPYW